MPYYKVVPNSESPLIELAEKKVVLRQKMEIIKKTL